MTDICAEGGITAQKEYYKTNYSKIEGVNRCTGGRQNYKNFLDRIITECPNHSMEIEIERLKNEERTVGDCITDIVTGEECFVAKKGSFKKPYSQWEPSECESNCVAEYDKVYREFTKFAYCDEYSYCRTFKNITNPLSSCGNKDFIDPGVDDSISEKLTNDATIVTSQVTLLVLIMCFIFAFFK